MNHIPLAPNFDFQIWDRKLLWMIGSFCNVKNKMILVEIQNCIAPLVTQDCSPEPE
jgi:hypothetical protein